MRYEDLGATGLTVSKLGLGCNSFGRRIDAAEAANVVAAAIDSGITFFDTADSYGDSELFLGRALRGQRDEAIIATKFGADLGPELGSNLGPRGGRRYIRAAIARSLARLQTDHLDLYQHHWPDPSTPIDQTLEALSELISEGRIRQIGASNYAAWQLADASWTARASSLPSFASDQVSYSAVRRGAREEILPACKHFGISPIAYRPLGSGLLTGKHSIGGLPQPGTKLAERPDLVTEHDIAVTGRLHDFARNRGIGLLELSLGTLAADPLVGVVIAGASSPAQVIANSAAFGWVPSAADLAEIDRLTR
jgi:aryl-alcohol dehydrogenase-like predicted oxidoreductase